MYKPKAIPAIRLPKVFDIPTAADVEKCMTQAGKMRGRAVELPWNSTQQGGDLANSDCVLQVTWFKDDDEPTWSMHKGDAGPRETMWKHMSRDLGLIAVLVERECLGAEADVSAGDRLGSVKKKAVTPEPEDDGIPVHKEAPPPVPGLDPNPIMGTAFPAFAGSQPISPFAAFPAAPGGAIAPMAMPAMGMQPMASPMGALPVAGGALPTPTPTPTPAPAAAASPSEANHMGFAAVEKKPARSSSMQGDLSNMKATVVLQSITAGKMSGLLEVSHNDATIEMFVEEGNAVHASAPDCKGEAAIMELLTWDAGKFQFFSDERTSDRSVVKRLDAILMEAAPVIDQFRFLNQTGITQNSYLVRKHLNISEMDFEQRIARGAVADLLKQKQFYQIIDGQSNLFELLRKLPLAKVDWIPCVYNLVVCDLVNVLAVPSQGAKPAPIEGLGIDRGIIQTAMQGMYRPETGLLNYPAVLYFLEQEYYRWEHTASPFSILVFDMCKRSFQGIEPLSVPALKEAARRIDTVKRNIDHLSHFENSSFMLFMPATKVQAAAHVAKRIAELLRDPGIGGELDSANMALAFGVAGVPDDCQDVAQLVAAAKKALSMSKQTGTHVMTFEAARRG